MDLIYYTRYTTKLEYKKRVQSAVLTAQQQQQQGYIIIPETQFQSWNRLDWIQPLSYIYIFWLFLPDRFHMLYNSASETETLYSVFFIVHLLLCTLT